MVKKHSDNHWSADTTEEIYSLKQEMIKQQGGPVKIIFPDGTVIEAGQLVAAYAMATLYNPDGSVKVRQQEGDGAVTIFGPMSVFDMEFLTRGIVNDINEQIVQDGGVPIYTDKGKGKDIEELMKMVSSAVADDIMEDDENS